MIVFDKNPNGAGLYDIFENDKLKITGSLEKCIAFLIYKNDLSISKISGIISKMVIKELQVGEVIDE